MADINSVIIVGNLTKDIEIRYTNSGFAIGTVSIAVNRRTKKNYAWVDEVSFFNVTILGNTATSLQPYLTKGKKVGIDGELRQSRWEKDGQARSAVDIVAEHVQLLSSNNNNAKDSNKSQDNSCQHPKQELSQQQFDDDFEDDIPF